MGYPHKNGENDVRQSDDEMNLWKKRIALGALGTAFTGSILLMSPFVIMQLRSPLPYMSTPRKKVIRALKEVASSAKKSNTKDHELRFMDLGSGDGEAVFAAASVGWRATGIEMNPTLWAVSSIRRLFSPPHVRKNCKFILGNMWSSRADLRLENAVMIFGVKPLMPKIADKISRECSSGTHVFSYRFRVPMFDETATRGKDSGSNSGFLAADLVYDHEEMRVYRVQ